MFKHTFVYNDNISVSNELENHTTAEFDKLLKFVGEHPVQFSTTYSKEGAMFKVHAYGTFDGVQYDAHVLDKDMYKGVDSVVNKLESQFRTAKGKRTNIDRNIDVQAETSDAN